MKITREQAKDILYSHMQSPNLRKHCLGVEVAMRGLAKHFGEDELMWGIVGLVHDGDYEVTKTDIQNHAKLMANWLREAGEDDELFLTGVESHGWFHQGRLPENKMQWALYCCDELTGLIVAVTLVRPNKKILEVTVENVLDKWNQKSFAAGVDRSQIGMCEDKLGIKLNDFVGIVLTSMQGISESLGL